MRKSIMSAAVAGAVISIMCQATAQPSNIDVTFADQAAQAGLGLGTNTQGSVFFDQNFDGREELYVAAGGFSAGLNVFYRSRGDLTFEIATSEVGLESPAEGSTMALAADFNNDGLTDLFVLSHGVGLSSHLYFRQRSGGFLDVTTSAGVENEHESHDALAWDYNEDGWLDLFITSANHSGPQANRLYRNNGDGTFTDVAPSLGLDLPNEWGMGAAAGDYDNDGDPDLYITNEFSGNHLFRNDGGVFTDVAQSAGVQAGTLSKAGFFEDYDADGWLDLYVVHRAGSNQLFRSNGDGTFTDVTTSAGIRDNAYSRTAGWADFDNDGWLDVFVGNSSNSNDLLWHNLGDGTFEEVALESGINDLNYSDGLSLGDPNGDGFMDLYVSNTDAVDRFYVNSGNENHWISIQPEGRTSTNGSGVGVQVTVVTGSHRQRREVQAGGGYQSAHSLPTEFGLGAAADVDSIILRWTDGDIEIYTDLEPNKHYIAIEDSALYPFALPPVSAAATPLNPPLVIPAIGGSFSFTADLINPTPAPISLDAWTEIRLPDNSSFGPIVSRPLNLLPGTLARTLTQSIPASAPAGQYTYYVFLGDEAEQSVWNYGSFEFTKIGSQDGLAAWNLDGWDRSAATGNDFDGVGEYRILGVSPNPFNPSTTVEFSLPLAGEASLTIYDLQGRRVWEMREAREAGIQHFEVPGENLGSGIYFLKLKTPTYTAETKILHLK